MKVNFKITDAFIDRHVGPSENEISEMLASLGVASIDEMIDKTIPENIRFKKDLNLPEAVTEYKFLNEFKQLAQKNKVYKSYIGLGYHNCVVPGVIKRNILENPAWYTAYTPYQAEIAQGRLEALINFQTLITDMTGMEIANASLLDEATAAAEAMGMMYALRKGKKKSANKFLVSSSCLPQTIDVLKSRAIPLGIELEIGSVKGVDFSDSSLFGDAYFGMLLQYPTVDGSANDYRKIVASAKEAGVMVAVAVELLSLALLTPPGEWGADIVVGTSQRFGVPLGYGGPHAGFFATKDQFKRSIPGRIIGESLDVNGNKAYRMALQTREQHIRREKATSNICTAQVLLAVLSSFYAAYHGQEGITAIANRIHGMAVSLSDALTSLGFKQHNTRYFDTLKVEVDDVALLKSVAENKEINFRFFENKYVGISLNETTTKADLEEIIHVFEQTINKETGKTDLPLDVKSPIPTELSRTTPFLSASVFNSYHAEHEMLRYIKRLESKDLSLVHSMISLGSCTMKLNATAEMEPVTWNEIANIHPFAPVDQAMGYAELFSHLNQWLCEITGFSGMSFQPNSGAQGEYAGLMVIREYLKSKNEGFRNIALIPASAHGTNPASAVMAGMKVVIIACDEKGNIDVDDLKAKAGEHKDSLAALMVTYPSTHGVFEKRIIEICTIVHENGGQVYMDGANMNAQVGLTSPANIGADVCHLNLHKTFCIPHGGGGPGVGPIGVAKHLVPFLPNHTEITVGDEKGIHAVSAAPYGSASILPISYAYMKMAGGAGLKKATQVAILNANYIKSRLEDAFPVLYIGENGFCAHELIVDFRGFKHEVGIEVADIAKRLMDYGFHAPTVSFPVAGTMMIEPTESEAKSELDRFCEAMLAIREEIAEIERGEFSKEDNVLKNAPHTAAYVMADVWERPYSRAKAAYPMESIKLNKFWPAVARIDNAYGDRNLICTCAPVEEFA